MRRTSMGWVTLGIAALVGAACGTESGSNDATGDPDAGVSGGDAGTSNDGGANADGGFADGGSDGGAPIVFDERGWSPSSTKTPHYFLQPDDKFRVESSRPRLYFRADDVAWLKQRATKSSASWEQVAWMASSMAEVPPTSATATDDVNGWYGDKGQAVAFLGFVEGKASYVDWAVAWAKALGAGNVPSDDTVLRSRLLRIALVYDWLHDRMSDDDRATIRSSLVKYVEALSAYDYIQNPGYIGGHERWGYAVFAAGLIALQGEYEKADALLQQCRKHIARGFYPTQAWIGRDGGYHMGWAYTSAYTNFDLPYYIWTVGTNDVLLDDWITDSADWYLYGLRGNDEYPEVGDVFGTNADLGAPNVVFGAGIGKSGHARWFLTNKLAPGQQPFLQALLNDDAVPATTPDTLPLGRTFRGAGVVIARDGWGADTTHFTFRSTPFYSANHHHRDENAFTLHYKKSLAIDSGVYDAYGSDHWKNYYTRTIAHNAVVVQNPDQIMKYGGQTVSNDGGQVFRSEPSRLADIQPGGAAALDGLVRSEHRADFSYGRGNATKAYDPATVTRAEREFVYLRNTGRAHPVVVIFDRVGATSGSYRKSFLLHTQSQPTLSGNVAVSKLGGARLTSVTVFPASATLATVGGPGKEHWVNGKNYSTSAGNEPPPTWETGAWRLEVSPSTPAKDDFLLHALFVDDDGAPAVTADDARRVTSNDAIGVAVAGWHAIFPRATDAVGEVSYPSRTAGASKHLVTGFAPGSTVSYAVDGATKGTTTVGEGGCAVFDVTASDGATVRVSP